MGATAADKYPQVKRFPDSRGSSEVVPRIAFHKIQRKGNLGAIASNLHLVVVGGGPWLDWVGEAEEIVERRQDNLGRVNVG